MTSFLWYPSLWMKHFDKIRIAADTFIEATVARQIRARDEFLVLFTTNYSSPTMGHLMRSMKSIIRHKDLQKMSTKYRVKSSHTNRTGKGHYQDKYCDNPRSGDGW